MTDAKPRRRRRFRPNTTGSADRDATCYAGQFHVPDTAGVGYCVRCGSPSGENTDPGPYAAADTALDDQLAPLRFDDDPDLWWL